MQRICTCFSRGCWAPPLPLLLLLLPLPLLPPPPLPPPPLPPLLLPPPLLPPPPLPPLLLLPLPNLSHDATAWLSRSAASSRAPISSSARCRPRRSFTRSWPRTMRATWAARARRRWVGGGAGCSFDLGRGAGSLVRDLSYTAAQVAWLSTVVWPAHCAVPPCILSCLAPFHDRPPVLAAASRAGQHL